MNPIDDFERVLVIVFGEFPGARYRAGRTCRVLRARFKRVVDATATPACELLKYLESGNPPLWFVRAGTVPRALAHWHLPHQNGIKKPMCGFGLVSHLPSPNSPRVNELWNNAMRSSFATLNHEASEWDRVQSETGGDFSIVDDFGERCPSITSVLLPESLTQLFAENFAQRKDIEFALRTTLSKSNPRCVRLPHLDVRDDPAMRVAQAVTSLQRGGAERIAIDLTRELPRYGVRALFFALGSPTRAAFEKPDELLEFAPGRNRVEHVRNFAARAIAVGCDAVHAHLLSASDMSIVAESGLPLIATVHNSKPGWPAGFATAISPFPANMLIACSQAVERDIRAAELGVPVRTVWNGIDARAFKRSPENEALALAWRSKLEFSANDFVLLSLANPRPQKRLERLPSVLAALQSEFRNRGIRRDAKLIVAGEASRTSDDAKRCEATLKAEIERLGLADSVRLIGAVENVAPLLLAADVLVSVSKWEGLSLAHLEALAAGCPVIATDAGGTSEIARENPALTVVPVDAPPEIIGMKLAEIVTRAPNAALLKRSSFTLQCMAERCASIYPRAIERSRGPRAGAGIWLIANNFTTGGAQSSARRLLLGFQADGIRVRATVLQERKDHPTPGLSALRSVGIPVFIPEPRSIDPLDAVLQILERIDTDPPQSILFWNVIAEHKILLADTISDIPIFDVSPGEMFFDSLDQYFLKPRPGLPYRTPAEYAARLSGVVVKYGGEVARAEASLHVKPRVIPNGLPLSVSPPLIERAVRDRFVMGTSARISPQKKLDELIRALRLAAPHLPLHVLKIAGRAESGGDAYAQSLKDLGAELNIEWIGEFQDARQFLGELDVFAMISEPAGCPNASLEAMAAGLPVIATDHGGASEQVDDRVTGLLVARADAQAFADALIELANNPDRCASFGNAGRARVEALFSVDRMVRDYRQLCGV